MLHHRLRHFLKVFHGDIKLHLGGLDQLNLIATLAWIFPGTELLFPLSLILDGLDVDLDCGCFLGGLLFDDSQRLLLIILDCIGEHVLDLLVSSLSCQT